MKNTEYAPVLVTTLNRYSHLKVLVESLAKCPEAKNTELLIGLDYPPSEKYVEGWNKIRGYLPTITGFKKVTVIEADYNLGPRGNANALREYAKSRGCSRFICSEDDNEFSPNFLAYMNWGLEKYKDDDRVLAISGYNYPLDMTGYDKEYYFSHEFSAFGWGMTMEKYGIIETDVLRLSFIDNLVKNPMALIKLTIKCGWRLTRLAFELHKKRLVYGDGYLTMYSYLKNKYCVFPTLSKVRNHGFDGSGVHCGDDEHNFSLFENQKIDMRSEYFDLEDNPVMVDTITKNKQKRFHRWNSAPSLKRLFNMFNGLSNYS